VGFDLYILKEGESTAELEARESAEHFGLRTKTMRELQELALQAGAGVVLSGDEEPMTPGEAREIADKLELFIASSQPGETGSHTDEEMLEIAHDFVSFCRRAAEQGGYVTW
jgi:hypothetical protein